MKKIISILAVAATIFTISSCDELADLLTVTFEDVELGKTLDISNLSEHIGDKSASFDQVIMMTMDFDTTSTFNVADAKGTSSEGDISEFVDKIKSATIDTIKYTIPSTYKGASIASDAQIDSVTISLVCTATGLDYEETFKDVTFGKTVMIDDVASISALSDAITNAEDISVTAKGTVKGSLTGFNIILDIIADIEANPLDAIEAAEEE